MRFREYTEEDFPIVSEWWTESGHPVLPHKVLPPIGVVAYNDEIDIFAAWLYMAVGVGVCWMAWPIANPDAPDRLKHEGYFKTCEYMIEQAKVQDYGVMVETYQQPSLIGLAQKRGAIVNHYSVAQLFSIIGQKEDAA